MFPRSISGGPKLDKCPSDIKNRPKTSCPPALLNRQRKGSRQDGAIDASSTTQTWALSIPSLREEEVLMEWRCCLREWKRSEEEEKEEKERPKGGWRIEREAESGSGGGGGGSCSADSAWSCQVVALIQVDPNRASTQLFAVWGRSSPRTTWMEMEINWKSFREWWLWWIGLFLDSTLFYSFLEHRTKKYKHVCDSW